MKLEVPGLKEGEESITFTALEWKHLLNEIDMRGVGEIAKCINNARFLAHLDISDEQIRKGQVVHKTWEELEAMAR